MGRSQTAGFCVGAMLALAGCGGGDAEAEREPSPDPSVERLEAACTEYREAAYAELPPASPAGYPAYLSERRKLVDRLIATVREAPESEGRARLLAAASEILAVVDETQSITSGGSFAGVMYTRTDPLEDFERGLDAAAEKAGIACGAPEEPSAELREFRTRAGEVCEAAGSAAGLPARDAALIRERAEGHAALSLPSDAGDLERETLAAERDLARVAGAAPRSPIIRDGDARYIALAARTSAGWSRQRVDACADLPAGGS